MQTILRVDQGVDIGRSLLLDLPRTYVIGRSRTADFSFHASDTHMSRTHFVIEVGTESVRLRDLGSQNGTYVNEIRVKEVALNHGDRIRAGKTSFRVAMHGIDDPIETRFEIATVPPQAADEPDPENMKKTVTDARMVPCAACGRSVLRSREGKFSSHLCRFCLDDAADFTQVVPDYIIVRELGRGGMGVVNLAIRKSDGERFAVKTVLLIEEVPTASRVTRLLREASILQDLIHPHIIAFHEMGNWEGHCSFVMEYVDGKDAGALLKTGGPFTVSRAVKLTCQLLEALDYAHAKGFIHRDIKPSNLLVTIEDGRESVKLADFGLARVLSPLDDAGHTHKTTLGGTPVFSAPEQILDMRQAVPATDQYAVAATLYYLLTKSHVHNFEGSDVYRMIVEDPHIPIRERRPDIPDDLAAILDRALQKDPGDRYKSVIEMRRALAKVVKTV